MSIYKGWISAMDVKNRQSKFALNFDKFQISQYK